MKLFEYQTESVFVGELSSNGMDSVNLGSYLNDLGYQGWELVSAIHDRKDNIALIFKRELDEGNE